MDTQSLEAQFHPEMDVAFWNERSREHLPEYLGMEVTAVGPGFMAGKIAIRKELHAPNGYLHAATVIALADSLCGYGCIAILPNGASGFTTIETKSNHLGTVREGMIACEARVVHAGKSTQVWDAIVTNAATGKTIALFRCTQMVLYR